jgi:hypothetical protein
MNARARRMLSLLVKLQAVDLNNARVAFHRLQTTTRARGQIARATARPTNGRSRQIRPAIDGGIDDLDRSRGVAESVTGDVEHDGGHLGIS